MPMQISALQLIGLLGDRLIRLFYSTQIKEDYLALSAKAKEATTKRPKVLFLNVDKWASQVRTCLHTCHILLTGLR